MKAFIIAICVLLLITVYIFLTSVYFLNTEQHLISALNKLEISNLDNSSELTIPSENIDELCRYIKKRNKILSLYIYRSKCTELEHLIREMHIHSINGDIALLQFAKEKLSEALRDIRENDAFLTLNGIM